MHSLNNYCNSYCVSKSLAFMEWYLVERDHTEFFGDLEDKDIPYCIIHLSDIYTNGCSFLFILPNILYERNKKRERGRVIVASDSKDYVEKQMKILMGNNETADNAACRSMLFLVVYKLDLLRFCAAIVKREQIIYPTCNILNQKHVIVNDCGQDRLAEIINMSNNESGLREYLWKLQLKFRSNLTFNLTYGPLPENPWILCQYRSSPWHLQHVVMEYQETNWIPKYQGKDNTVYVEDGNITYVGEIIHRSENCYDLINNLDIIRTSFSKEMGKIPIDNRKIPYEMHTYGESPPVQFRTR